MAVAGMASPAKNGLLERNAADGAGKENLLQRKGFPLIFDPPRLAEGILPRRLASIAGVAQLVEHFLAKEDVASSSLVTRST